MQNPDSSFYNSSSNENNLSQFYTLDESGQTATFSQNYKGERFDEIAQILLALRTLRTIRVPTPFYSYPKLKRLFPSNGPVSVEHFSQASASSSRSKRKRNGNGNSNGNGTSNENTNSLFTHQNNILNNFPNNETPATQIKMLQKIQIFFDKMGSKIKEMKLSDELRFLNDHYISRIQETCLLLIQFVDPESDAYKDVISRRINQLSAETAQKISPLPTLSALERIFTNFISHILEHYNSPSQIKSEIARFTQDYKTEMQKISRDRRKKSKAQKTDATDILQKSVFEISTYIASLDPDKIKCTTKGDKLEVTIIDETPAELWNILHPLPIHKLILLKSPPVLTSIQIPPSAQELIFYFESLSGPENILEHISLFECGDKYIDDMPRLYPSIQSIKVGNGFYKEIDLSAASNLRSLSMGNAFNNPINLFPATLESLTLGDSFNQSLASLSNCVHLKKLVLGHSFNQPIDLRPFASLETLALGNAFAQNIDFLPLSLSHISIGNSFEMDTSATQINWESLTNLKYLSLGDSFNTMFIKYPPNLVELRLGNSFNHILNILPFHLEKLTLGRDFSKKLPILLPDSLVSITTSPTYKYRSKIPELTNPLSRYANMIETINQNRENNETLIEIFKFVENVHAFTIQHNGREFLTLRITGPVYKPMFHAIHIPPFFVELQGPPRLARLPEQTFGCVLDGPDVPALNPALQILDLGNEFDANVSDLPQNLVHLDLGHKFQSEIINIPASLEALFIGDSYNRPFAEGLLSSLFRLSKLEIGHGFNAAWQNEYPPNLLELKLGDAFDQPLLVPESLEKLSIGHSFNQEIDITPNLISLSIGNSFNSQIHWETNSLSAYALEELRLGDSYNVPLDLTSLSKLRKIELGNGFNSDIRFSQSLRNVALGNAFDRNIDKFPNNLQKITIGNKFSKALPLMYNNQRVKINIRNPDYVKLNVGERHSQYAAKIEAAQQNFERKAELLSKIPGITSTVKYIDEARFEPENFRDLQNPRDSSSMSDSDLQPQLSVSLHDEYNQEYFTRVFGKVSVQIVDALGLREELNYELPGTVKYFCTNYLDVTKLSSSLIYLQLGDEFNSDIPNLPRNIKYLEIGNGFNSSLPTSWANGFEYLSIGNGFDGNISSMANTRCKYLRLGDRFNHLLPALPKTIETIILGRAFNQEIPLQPHLAPDFVRATGKLSLRIDNPDYGYLIPSVELIRIYLKVKKASTDKDLMEIFKFIDGVSLKKTLSGSFVLQIKKQVHWDIINLRKYTYLIIYGNIHISKFPQTSAIIIDDNFNNPLPSLPEKLDYLKIGDPSVPVEYAKFNQPLPKLPLSLKNLILGNKFNHPLNLADNIELWCLSLGDSFDSDLNMPLNTRLTTALKIGDAYNRPLNLNNVPIGYLEIGDSFNSNFSGQNLRQLNTLIIGNSFNGEIYLNIRVTIKHLLLGDSYNGPLIVTAKSLDTLILGNSFNYGIHIFPLPGYQSVSNPAYDKAGASASIIKKSKDPKYVYNHINTYFKDWNISCKENGTLHINEKCFVFPSKIFEKMPIHTIQFNFFPYITSIPFNIKNIIINTVETNFNPNFFYLDHIEKFVVKQYDSFEKLLFPRKLRELELHCIIELSESYPDTLTKLSFIGEYNKQIEILPPNLEELIIGDKFDHDLPEFPETLRKLVIGNSFNRRLPDLPENIVTVKIGDAFDQPISRYPVAGGRLELGKSFNQILPDFESIPNGLFDIIVHNTEYCHPLPDINDLYKDSINSIPNYNNEDVNLNIYGVVPWKIMGKVSGIKYLTLSGNERDVLNKMLFEKSKFFTIEKLYYNLNQPLVPKFRNIKKLHYLTLGPKFNQIVKTDYLPESLIWIKNENRKYSHTMPDFHEYGVWKSKPSKLSLNGYHLENLFSQNWDGHLWTGLKSINITVDSYDEGEGEIFFPETLVKIETSKISGIEYNFSVVPKIFYSAGTNHFPNGILLLDLYSDTDIPHIPESVIELRLHFFSHVLPISDFITPYLKIFVTNFDVYHESDNFMITHIFPRKIPPNLKEFCIYNKDFVEPLPFEIPETLERIVICNPDYEYRDISNKIILMTRDEYKIIMDAREKEIYGEDETEINSMENDDSANDSIILPNRYSGSPSPPLSRYSGSPSPLSSEN
jgi:hypothetical protein